MKIAEKIEAALDECELLPANMSDDDHANAAAIIAVELRPIRDALTMMWENPEGITPSDMVAQYTEALEMLEEAE